MDTLPVLPDDYDQGGHKGEDKEDGAVDHHVGGVVHPVVLTPFLSEHVNMCLIEKTQKKSKTVHSNV